jgi:hypothetical protein
MKQPIEKSSEPPSDRVLTIRVAPELYDAIVGVAGAARHSINTCATILLEEALTARDKWPPKSGSLPFWRKTRGPRKP